MENRFLRFNIFIFFIILYSVKVFAQTLPPTVTTASDIEPLTGIPKFGLTYILSFAVKAFFTIAALISLYQLIRGAFQWINSGGDKEAIEEARNKIQAAVIGLILIFAIIAIGVTLERAVFKENICFGLSCEIKIPGLLSLPTDTNSDLRIDWSEPTLPADPNYFPDCTNPPC